MSRVIRVVIDDDVSAEDREEFRRALREVARPRRDPGSPYERYVIHLRGRRGDRHVTLEIAIWVDDLSS